VNRSQMGDKVDVKCHVRDLGRRYSTSIYDFRVIHLSGVEIELASQYSQPLAEHL